MTNQPLQRSLSWTASPAVGSLSVDGYTATCSTSTPSETRLVSVSGSTTTATIGSGSGDNAPLVAKGTYTCTVTATNTAGTGAAAIASAFSTSWCYAQSALSYISTSTEMTASPYTIGAWQDDTRSSASATVVNAPVQLSGVTVPALKLSCITSATTSNMKASVYFGYQSGTECSAICGGAPYTEYSPYCGSQSSLGSLNQLTSMVFNYYRASGGTAITYASPTVRLRVSNLPTPTQTFATWADLGK